MADTGGMHQAVAKALANHPCLDNIHPEFVTKAARMACGDRPSVLASCRSLMRTDPLAAVLMGGWGGGVSRAWILQLCQDKTRDSILLETLRRVVLWRRMNQPGCDHLSLIREWFTAPQMKWDAVEIHAALEFCIGQALERVRLSVGQRSFWWWLGEHIERWYAQAQTGEVLARVNYVWHRHDSVEEQDLCLISRLCCTQDSYDLLSFVMVVYHSQNIPRAQRLLRLFTSQHRFRQESLRIYTMFVGSKVHPLVNNVAMTPFDIMIRSTDGPCYCSACRVTEDPLRCVADNHYVLNHCNMCRRMASLSDCISKNHYMADLAFPKFGHIAICIHCRALKHVVQGATVAHDARSTRRRKSGWSVVGSQPGYVVYPQYSVGTWAGVLVDTDSGLWSCARKKGSTVDRCANTELHMFSGLNQWLYFKGQCYFVCRCSLVTLWRISACGFSRGGPLCPWCKDQVTP